MARTPTKGSGPTTRPPAGPGSSRAPGSVRTGPPVSKDTINPPTLRPPPSRPDPQEVAGPPPPKDTLDEVERALSALDGRHHDAARAQRETQLSIAARRAAVDEAERRALAAEKRTSVLRVVFGVLGAAALAGGGWYGNARYQRKVAADAALTPLASPFLAAGWQTFPRPIWKSRHRTEAQVGANTCVLALASTNPGDGKLVVERPTGTLTGETSLAFCTCNDEQVSVHTDGVAGGGVQLLFQEAIGLGGNSALAFLSPKPASIPVTDTCKVDPLDAWLAAGKGASPPMAESLAPATRSALEQAGWKLAASAPPELPFASVSGAADTCFIAQSSVAGEALTLREAGGGKPLHPAAGAALAMGWCTHAAQPMTVWRTGAGSVVVYKTSATALGGTLGLRERAGALGDVPAWVAPTERAWDASLPLLMSGIPSPDIVIPADNRPITHTRVVSLTIGSGHVTPVPDELDRYLCTPSLELNPPSAVCVQSLALGWKPNGPEVVGVAESPLPFWMDVMSQVEDRHGLEVEQRLLALSRRLKALHYEATARAGVLEEREGVMVVGQAGDDRVIAVGVLSTPPWVLPYTSDIPWTLDSEPQSLPIMEGQEVHLVTRPWVKIPPEVRRTVVFRHHI